MPGITAGDGGAQRLLQAPEPPTPSGRRAGGWGEEGGAQDRAAEGAWPVAVRGSGHWTSRRPALRPGRDAPPTAPRAPLRRLERHTPRPPRASPGAGPFEPGSGPTPRPTCRRGAAPTPRPAGSPPDLPQSGTDTHCAAHSAGPARLHTDPVTRHCGPARPLCLPETHTLCPSHTRTQHTPFLGPSDPSASRTEPRTGRVPVPVGNDTHTLSPSPRVH